jgi:hypothetical protein
VDLDFDVVCSQTDVNHPPVSCRGATYTRIVQGKVTLLHYRTVATASLLKERQHTAPSWGCRHAKEDMQKRKAQRTPKNTTEREFSSK